MLGELIAGSLLGRALARLVRLLLPVWLLAWLAPGAANRQASDPTFHLDLSASTEAAWATGTRGESGLG